MRVPLEWLHEYCAPELDAHELAERLALTGTDVERVERHGVTALEHFVVGHVLERRKHPDADRLSVCMVDIGRSTPAQIVCGAPNVTAGQTVAVARPGAVMPDGRTLQKAHLRGQTSDGMILAEDELAIGTDHEGIMVLEDGVAPGTPLEEILPIATEVLVLEVTPNRPDCLGIYGVAREVHAATGAPLAPPPWETQSDLGSSGRLEGVEIVNDAGELLCPRFTTRVFEGLRLGPSPLWLKARLMAAGMRPISNVVDVTNYVMLLTGQPMHAYDLDRVAGGRLTVRRAQPGEVVHTLDGQSRTLHDDAVLIEDGDGPDSVAGVMGGARTEVSPDTTRVLSEVATWYGPNVHRTSLALGLRSEASSRYEKGLQPEQAMWAQVVATRLFVEVCGATVRPGTIDVGGPGPAPATIRLRDARIASLLGVEIPRERSRRILDAIGFSAEEAPDGLDVTVPDFRRSDVTREADVIEEVARLDGLDNLPATLPARRRAVGRLSARQLLRRRIADALAAQGLHEVVGWSFTGPDQNARLRLGDTPAVVLQNPMSGESSQLRTTLLGSLLDIAGRNRSHGAAQLRLFEMGAVYRPAASGGPSDPPDAHDPPEEPLHLGVLLSGPVRRPGWREANPPPVDFFGAKSVLAGLLDSLALDWEVSAESEPFLHPGRCALVSVEGAQAGWLGEIHPTVAAEWDLDGAVAAFELDLDVLPLPARPMYRDLVTYPEVREDLAIVVSEHLAAAELLEVVRAAGRPLLARAEVFDVYRDAERLGPESVSLALRLAYRAPDRTLTDTEVAIQRSKIIAELEQELGARVRDS